MTMQEENQTPEVTAEQPAPEAQAKPETPETTAQPTEAAQEQDDKNQPRDEKGQFKSPVQARMDELTRARREAEREAAYWRQRATPAETPPAPPAKPTVEQFKDYGEYVEALTEWKAEQIADKKVQTALSTRDQESAKSAEQRVAEAKQQSFSERQAAAKTSIPDYDAVVGAADVAIAPHVGEAILESDKGPELVYHLAKNPAEAARLSALSPLAAAREIGRIEASLEKPSKPITKAPAPMKPTAGNGSSRTTDPSQMSHEEYRAYRAKQGAKWA